MPSVQSENNLRQDAAPIACKLPSHLIDLIISRLKESFESSRLEKGS